MIAIKRRLPKVLWVLDSFNTVTARLLLAKWEICRVVIWEPMLIEEGDTCDRRREWAIHLDLSQVQLQYSIGDFNLAHICVKRYRLPAVESQAMHQELGKGFHEQLRALSHHTNQDAAQHLGPATGVLKLDKRILWGENLRHRTKGHHKCTDSFASTQGCPALKGSKTSPIGCYWVCRRPENVWLSGCPKEGFRPEITSKLKLRHLSHDGHHQAKLYTGAEVSTWTFVCQISAVSNVGISFESLVRCSVLHVQKIHQRHHDESFHIHACSQCIGMQDP